MAKLKVKKLMAFMDAPDLAQFNEMAEINDGLAFVKEKFAGLDFAKLQAIKGEKGDPGVPGKDGQSLVGPMGPKGLSGRDGKDGKTPVAGVDFQLPKDGKDGLNGKNGDIATITPKLLKQNLETLQGDERLDGSAVKGVFSPAEMVKEMQKLPLNQRLEVTSLRNWQSLRNESGKPGKGGIINNPESNPQDLRWHGGGSGAATYTATAVSYVIPPTTAGVAIIGVTDTTAPRTITLPPIATTKPGQRIIVKDEQGHAGTNPITLAAAAGETIDNIATYVWVNDYESIPVYSTGTQWFIS